MLKTIGVLTSGGDAPGMNAAVRSVVRSAIGKGIKIYGIERGYSGLIHRELDELHERSVSDIIQRGGTVLYTARCPEFKEQSGRDIAFATCKEYGLEGLVVIGGDGSFRGAGDMTAMGIPCIGIPGTIDNDIACTDYTIGYDTAMNTAMEMMDKLRDTAQSHDRCSVVEVMGRHAGYIALNVGIACGSVATIVPEMPYSLDDIAAKMLKTRELGKQHFIVVVSEGVGNVAGIAHEIEQKTGIESRATILGHVQRGGAPTVRDRVTATNMGYYAVELLSQGIGNRVIAEKDGKIVDFDIKDALAMKKEFNKELYNIANRVSF